MKNKQHSADSSLHLKLHFRSIVATGEQNNYFPSFDQGSVTSQGNRCYSGNNDHNGESFKIYFLKDKKIVNATERKKRQRRKEEIQSER